MKKVRNNSNILLTCVNRKVHILHLLKQTFPKKKIYVSDHKNDVISKYFTNHFWNSPIFIDKNFNRILRYLKKEKIGYIFPTSDTELKFWSKHKNLLKKNKIFVMVSDYKTIQICLDKLKFYNFLRKNNILTIQTSSTINSIKAKKFVVKSRFGSGEKNSFLNLDRVNSIKMSKKIKNPIFQKHIKGKEISIDCFVGKKNKIILRYRDLINKGESEKTSIFKNNKITKIINNLIQKLNFEGHIMFQGFVLGKNFYLNECNPRIGGASVVVSYHGLNSFLLFIKENSNLKVKHSLKKNRFKSFIIHKSISPIN